MAPLGDRDRVGKVVPSFQGRTSMPDSHIIDHQVRLYMLFRQENALRAAAAKTGFSSSRWHCRRSWRISGKLADWPRLMNPLV